LPNIRKISNQNYLLTKVKYNKENIIIIIVIIITTIIIICEFIRHTMSEAG